MIDVKQAVQIAKASALDMLNESSTNLEEIERERYRDQEVWSITLSLPRDLTQMPEVAALTAPRIQYKRFLIDVETGDLVAMKLREVSTQ